MSPPTPTIRMPPPRVHHSLIFTARNVNLSLQPEKATEAPSLRSAPSAWILPKSHQEFWGCNDHGPAAGALFKERAECGDPAKKSSIFIIRNFGAARTTAHLRGMCTP